MKQNIMDRITLSHRIIYLALLSYFLPNGCQDEITINPLSKDQVIMYNSKLADLVKRISMKDGSADNILDRASCLSVKLPVKVNDNGHVVEIKSINSTEDLLIMKNILKKYDNEEGKLSLVFPVTVTLPDFTEKTVRNEDDFQDLVNQCIEGGGDEDIECIDFIYPRRISYYDQIKQSSHGITLYDDKSLFTFFNELNENYLVSFNFPVILVLNGDQRIQITNNQSMIDMIEDVAENCEEHDDTIFYEDDSDLRDFLIQTGPWKISSFFDDSENKEIFGEYTFLFELDGTISENSGYTAQAIGSWMTQGKYGVLELDLDFIDNDPFDKIKVDWNITFWGFEEGWGWPVINLISIGSDNEKTKTMELVGWME